MFHRFTERARQVVVLAQGEARALKHNYIGTEHILLGLLREEEGTAARVLELLGLSVERVRIGVVRIVGSGEEVTSGQIPFTPHAKKVLELALREALSLGHNYIGTEHILLGLVRENEGVAARVLVDLDVDSEKIREEVILSGPGRGQCTGGHGEDSSAALEMDLERRHEQLRRANKSRIARARLKRELRRGRLDLAELLRDPPPEVVTARVADLLLAAPGWGRVRTNLALNGARISPSKSVGGLSDRQRRELLDWVRRPPRDPS